MAKAFVIGHPIAHSRSPLIHGHWLETLGLAGSYERIDVPPADLPGFIRGFRERGYVGGNVTIPHKEAVFDLVDETTEVARRLGAVNTLWTEPDGRIVGHNTDAAGYVASLDEALGPGWRRQVGTALVVGAGGAARAVVAGLLDAGLDGVLVANRSSERAESLRDLDPVRVRALEWERIEGAFAEVSLLVNATSLGMAGQPAFGLDLSGLPDDAVVSDIVYVPLETPLLAQARARGLRTVGGLGMLLHQAVPGFQAWFGTRPEVTPELRALAEADVKRDA